MPPLLDLADVARLRPLIEAEERAHGVFSLLGAVAWGLLLLRLVAPAQREPLELAALGFGVLAAAQHRQAREALMEQLVARHLALLLG